jgi:hypothetical protein
MKKILILNLFIISAVTLYSCHNIIDTGKWDDNIHLSAREFTFNASGDSAIINTEGTSWWISDIEVDTTYYYGFTDINMQEDNYSIKKDCFFVEHRDKKTLFVKVNANPFNVKRIITIGFEAGDYFDRITITQNSNYSQISEGDTPNTSL